MKTLLLALLLAVAAAPARAEGPEAAPAPGTAPEAEAAAPAPGSAAEAQATAPADAVAAAPVSTPEPVPAPARSLFYEGPRYGLQLDAGVPSGAALQVVVRPWKFLRAGVGAAYNYLGMGVKGGLTLIPFHWYITPTFSLEAGRFFPADASRLVGGDDPVAQTLLSRVGYDYLSADLGIEFGSENRFVFFLRAGLSELRPTVGDINAALRASDPSLRVTASEPTLRARIPTVRLGFLVYVF